MDNVLGFESLYAEGIGFNVGRGINAIMATESSDGDNDALWSEAQSQENLIRFIDTHEQLQRKNTADKIRMFKKISAKYGRASKSVENWCNIQSREAEESEGDSDNAEAVKKKQNIFVKIFSAIAKFFKSIFAAIRNGFSKLSAKIKGQNKITPEEMETIDEELKKPSEGLKKHCLKIAYTLHTYDDGKIKDFALKFNKCAEHLEDITKDMEDSYSTSKELKNFDTSKYVNTLNILKDMLSDIPGLKNEIPALASSNIKDRVSFALAINKMIKELDYEKHSAEYIKYLTGIEKIEKEEVYPSDIFGPSVSYKVMEDIIYRIMVTGKDVIGSMDASTKIVQEIDRKNAVNLAKVLPFSKSKVLAESQAAVLALAKILSKLNTIMSKSYFKCMDIARDAHMTHLGK